MRNPEDCTPLYARKPTVIDSPEFGACKDCGTGLIMLKYRAHRHAERLLIAACPKCDVVQSTRGARHD